ncbi:AraC-type DNA-binding protein [Belliella buryatensis]|uniref:AraC-type DNA-binding protein n=1 Tax=Belliella buryatensis TaxID=1500549 RepID=A0A239H6H9_9BACT|nr:AraC family transcriptional regulator [Belliella buryatensis]SNS76832.1 AraC-type DNA-binding protein [Belliella buryatensis]
MKETDLDDISKYIIDQELYKNPDLDSWLLAQKLEMEEEELLVAIKNKTGKPFKQVINEIRVKRLVRNLDKTILFQKPGYYYKLSGFKSRTPFERMFKKETGMTLSEYIRKLKSINQKIKY